MVHAIGRIKKIVVGTPRNKFNQNTLIKHSKITLVLASAPLTMQISMLKVNYENWSHKITMLSLL